MRPWLDHVFLSFCSSSQEIYEYVMNWLALPLQKGAHKTGVMLVVVGGQGLGKGLFFNQLLGRVYGKHHLQISNAEHFDSRFNLSVASKLFINIDETAGLSQGERARQLKSKVTEPKVLVEPKFKEPFMISSYTNYALCSNDSNPVAVEADCRRFLMLKITAVHQNDHGYYGPLADLINDDRFISLFVRYLLCRDLSSFVVHRLPATDAKKKLQDITRTPHIAFLQHVALEGWISGFVEAKDKRVFIEVTFDKGVGETTKVPKALFYSAYEEFFRKTNQEGKLLSKTAFGTMINEVMDLGDVRYRFGVFDNPISAYIFSVQQLIDTLKAKNFWSVDQY